jgi:signal transduction histidine kinase
VNAIEEGGIKLNPTLFDIRETVNRIVESYTQRAVQKNILLHYSFPDEAVMTLADERLTEQVVENLISNAVKYSPPNKNVFVRMANNGKENANSQNVQPATAQAMVRIEVQDEGPGISEEDKKKLFGKFSRLSAQPTGGEHSTGLGLSIVKNLVEVMNGEVWCDSVLGEGAVFILELPKRS